MEKTVRSEKNFTATETTYDDVEVIKVEPVKKRATPSKPAPLTLEQIIYTFVPAKDIIIKRDSYDDLIVEFILPEGRSIKGKVNFNKLSEKYQLILADGTDYKDDLKYLKPMEFGKVKIFPDYQKHLDINTFAEVALKINLTIQRVIDINKGFEICSLGGMKAVKGGLSKKAKARLALLENGKEDEIEEVFEDEEAEAEEFEENEEAIEMESEEI